MSRSREEACGGSVSTVLQKKLTYAGATGGRLRHYLGGNRMSDIKVVKGLLPFETTPRPFGLWVGV